jgi:hypothetical protein
MITEFLSEHQRWECLGNYECGVLGQDEQSEEDKQRIVRDTRAAHRRGSFTI